MNDDNPARTKSRRSSLIPIGLLILLVAILLNVPVSRTQNRELDDVREVVFREILPKSGTAYMEIETAPSENLMGRLLRVFHVYSHSGAFADADPAFLQRFRDLPITFKPGSITTSFNGNLIDSTTKQGATIYTVWYPERVSSSEYRVRARYYCGGLCAEGAIYVVGLQNGKWTITSSYNRYISFVPSLMGANS